MKLPDSSKMITHAILEYKKITKQDTKEKVLKKI